MLPILICQTLKEGRLLPLQDKQDPQKEAQWQDPHLRCLHKDKAEPSSATSRSSDARGPYRAEPQENKPDKLEQKWKSAREQVGLLTTRMNGLWQEFYSMDDMSSRENIQRNISETSLRLQKAKGEEAQAGKEYQQARTGARKKR